MAEEKIMELEVERLKDFRNHPFRVTSDGEMRKLMKSIEQFGILTPLLVRPMDDGMYEIISGHRRRTAAVKAGFRKVPVIIRSLNDDEAVIKMVDSNLQRENILPSEKAQAIRMKYEALRKNKGRKKRSMIDYNTGRRTVEVVAEISGDSPKQIQRYLKITNLTDEFLQKLDRGEISFNPAVALAELTREDQKKMLSAMEYTQSVPSLSQAQRIRELSREGELTGEKMEEILSEVKKGETDRVVFKNEQLYRFFPKYYSAARMKREIIEILRQWKENSWER